MPGGKNSNRQPNISVIMFATVLVCLVLLHRCSKQVVPRWIENVSRSHNKKGGKCKLVHWLVKVKLDYRSEINGIFPSLVNGWR